MYDELKERCRACSQGCIYPSKCSYFDKPPLRCMRQLLSEAADSIEELSRENESLAKSVNEASKILRRRWIPVAERLPEDLQNVLVIDDGRVTIGHCEHYYGEEEVYVEWHDTLYYPIDPPCWMPLPEPPTAEEGET